MPKTRASVGPESMCSVSTWELVGHISKNKQKNCGMLMRSRASEAQRRLTVSFMVRLVKPANCSPLAPEMKARGVERQLESANQKNGVSESPLT